MSWKTFSVTKLVLGLIVLIIGIILKFPVKLLTYPVQYEILPIELFLTEAQYSVVVVLSYILIVFSIGYLVILFLNKSKN